MLFTREIISTVTFWIGRPICHLDLLLATGVKPNGEVMMKIMHLTGNLDVFRGPIMNRIIRLMVSGIVRLTPIQNMKGFGMAILALKTMVIEDMINLPGLLEMTMVMIMHMMMIMTTSPEHPLIIVGRIAMRGIMIMVDIVMILIMKEVVEEIVIGGDANHVIGNELRVVIVGKEI